MANLKDTRFTLMAFPQKVDAEGNLTLNIIFIPRNFNPLKPVNTIFGTANQAPAFAATQPVFSVMIVNNADEFPGKLPAQERAEPAPTVYSMQVQQIYQKLKDAKDSNGKPKYFDIDETLSTDNPAQPAEHRAPAAQAAASSVKKYLPQSYRSAFNFTSPRSRNAVTDDSYHCAMRDEQPHVPVPPNDKVSWGKVYAHLLRQPLMAEKAGLLYKTTIQLKPNDYKTGGWLYIDIAPGQIYATEQAQSFTLGGDVFVKRYAARIPALKKDTDGKFIPRSLFAAILFPVMKPGQSPTGIYDDLYIESAEYNDGYAKVVHANQPVSANLLAEAQDGLHPQKEMGIRLGWDDEQILEWYLRQLAIAPNETDRLDAPLGVMGYHIDVKYNNQPDAKWESLTSVNSNGSMMLEDISIGIYNGELPFQVYPVKVYGVAASNYWLPMYFSNWNDYSLVIPDKTAAEIYQNNQALQKIGGKMQNRNVQISDTYTPKATVTKLRYKNTYCFRVRLADISGGGPTETDPYTPTLSSEGHAAFKRYVAPYALRVKNKMAEPSELTDDDPINDNVNIIRHSTDDMNFNGDTITVQRPLLGYPAVVYTGKYADPVALLKASVQSQLATGTPDNPVSVTIGLADPDVTAVAIKVEVETLQMDNLASDSGKENYITLYNTTRTFDAANFDAELPLTFQYKDYTKLNLDALGGQPFNNPTDDATLDATDGPLILPTCRNIRITIRAVCEGDNDYWGCLSKDPALDSRYGKETVFKMRRNSVSEPKLFTDSDDAKLLQGIYLQPDPQPVFTGKITIKQVLPVSEGLPDIVQRLGKQLDVNCNNMTLTANKGERLQFWCSNLIRHTLSPDNSSITFAGKNELTHHWLVITTLTINRDWTWDGLETLSFDISRKKSTENNPTDAEQRKAKIDGMLYQSIGNLELKRIAPYQAIQAGDDGLIHREYTKTIFIDVIDSLSAPNKLPDTILAQYKITPAFKEGITTAEAYFETRNLLLPTTINPYQMPKITGAGIALSPYMRNDKYSFTEPRKRFLWLEFEHAPDDSRDTIFARQLAYAPDQLLSNNHPSLYEIKDEPPLPVDPEYVRVITPDSAHDHAGLKAMQKMEKSADAGRHFYLLPLPEGLHGESAELFGFHTYEFRFGHTDKLWSTAQGRFGRPFRLTGLQHPAPNLICNVNRDDKQLRVSAPFAMAVHNGRNVTANPPRTSIWCLLYAQVKQADGKGYRNILISEKKLQPETIEWDLPTTKPILPTGVPVNTAMGITVEMQKLHMKLALKIEAVKYAYGVWTNTEIEKQLNLYGLPDDSSLSVVCVEVFGYIRSIAEHIDNFSNLKEEIFESVAVNLDKDVAVSLQGQLRKPVTQPKPDESLPLSDHLGLYRILRTSPLTEVPFVCCTT